MYQRSIVAAIRRADLRARLIVFTSLLLLVFALSVAMVFLRLPAAATAFWWPAAGISALIAIAGREYKKRVALSLVLVTALANLVAGTGIWLSLGFGLANAAEALLVSLIAVSGRKESGVLGQRDVVRFLTAALVGAGTAGVLAATAVSLLGGGNFWLTFPAITASHASAVLIITPLGLIPRFSVPKFKILELTAQFILLLAVAIAVFSSTQASALAYLPFPVLLWAVFRLGTSLVSIELLIVSVLAASFTLAGTGPFQSVNSNTPSSAVTLLQLYVLTMSGSVLFLAAVQSDRNLLLSNLAAREGLLRGGIVNARAAFLIGDLNGTKTGQLRVLEANPAALKAFNLEGITSKARDVILDVPDELLTDFMALVYGEKAQTTSTVQLNSDGLFDVQAFTIGRPGSDTLIAMQSIDMTEQARMQAALSSALETERITADRLRDLNRQKDDFVSSVSHELRTPLTTILGYAVELEDLEIPAPGNDFVQIIIRSTKRLADLVEDLLQVARTTPGPRPEVFATTNLSALVIECVEEMQPIAVSKNISVELQLPAEPIIMQTIPLHISRTMTNLLSNALKFSPSGSQVRVTMSCTSDGSLLSVIDEGPGISPQELDYVFERFYRTAASMKSAIPGTGLGLSIVRDMVTQIGGNVWLESDGIKGTTATVQLPRRSIPAKDNSEHSESITSRESV